MDRPLRISTLNCWNVSPPYDERMALIREGITALRPDVIGLQEIIVRGDGFDQGKDILDGLGYTWVYGAAMRWDEHGNAVPYDAEGDAFGNLIASRWPIVRSEVRQLPDADSGEYRSATAALIETPDGQLPVICTHLNWKFEHGYVREQQVYALGEFLREWGRETTLPPVIVGDFNAEPDSAEVRFLTGLQSMHGQSLYLQDAWRVAGDGSAGDTWDNTNPYAAIVHEPNRRIDYIFVALADPTTGRGQIKSTKLAWHQATNAIYPSDHFGVCADVRW